MTAGSPAAGTLPVDRAALIVLDGWGIAAGGPGNAVSLARTPVFDELWYRYPHTFLVACGRAVGLPEGQMGNSEVGHLNLGAGAVVMQDLTRIDQAVERGELAANRVLQEAFVGAQDTGDGGGRVHLIGLVSDGGVHSGLTHLEALIRLAAELDVSDLVLHAFTDGRDTLPKSGAGYLETVAGWMADAGVGRIGSVVGRYYAMDRDRRWGRVQLAFDLLVHGQASHTAQTGAGAARAAYERGETDEFITPVLVGAEARIRPGDSVIAAQGERQLHVAETEKYPHVTYFFNGGEETPYDGERREMVASPRDVPTYDFKPEMSAPEAATAFVDAWRADLPTFGIINFANADMVGHTGVIEAAVIAVETVDTCLGRVIEAVQASGGACIVTADHGNADHMLEPDGSPNTAHSMNPVPLLVTVPGLELRSGGVLADVAATMLQLLGIEQPAAMTGRSLIVS